MSEPRILIVSGEPSGDYSASMVCRSLRKQLPGLEVTAVGGTHLKNAGAHILFDISKLSVMGFIEPLRKLPDLIRLKKLLLKHIHESKPALVLLVDFSGFNLYMARQIRRRPDTPLIAYLSPPQVWAWNKSRKEDLRKYCDILFPLFEFEQRLYSSEGIASYYSGHVLSSTFQQEKYHENITENQGALRILLCPGSRAQEVQRILPLMIECCTLFHAASAVDLKIFIAASPNLPLAIYESGSAAKGLPVEIIRDKSWAAREFDLALSKPGTVNLELAATGQPFLVMYKTSRLTYEIARRVALVKYVSIVNLLAGREIVKEFIQYDAVPEKIVPEMQRIVMDAEYRSQITSAMTNIVQQTLPRDGVPAEQAIADKIISTIKKAMIL